MDSGAIVAAAGRFGLTVERIAIVDSGEVFNIFKGANQIFTGRAGDVAAFLADYEKNLPGLYEGSIVNYTE